MGQQARQAAAGQGRDRGGEAPSSLTGPFAGPIAPDAGRPPQVREVTECEGRWLLAGPEACPLPLPVHPDFSQSLLEGSWRGLGKGNSAMPPSGNEFSSLGASLVGEDLTRALQLRAFPDAGSACKPGIPSSQPQGLLPDSDLHAKSPHAI